MAFAVMIAVIAGAAMGCGRSTPSQMKDVSPSRFASPVYFGGLLPVPEATLSAEDRAWEVYHASRVGDWEAAACCYMALVADARRIPATAENAQLRSQMNVAIRNLADAITVRDTPSAMNHANDITALTAQLADPYRKEVPTEARMMSFYARRLEIFVMSANVGQLRDAATRMGSNWQRLRPLVVAHGGAPLADEFGITMARLINAQQVSDFVPLIETAIQQIEEIDILFRTTDEEEEF